MKNKKELMISYGKEVIEPLKKVNFKNDLLTALNFARQILIEVHDFDKKDSEQKIKELNLEVLIQFCEYNQKGLIENFENDINQV